MNEHILRHINNANADSGQLLAEMLCVDNVNLESAWNFLPVDVRSSIVNSLDKIQHDLVLSTINQCIELCQSRVGNSDYNTGRMHCVSDIKEHFSIK